MRPDPDRFLNQLVVASLTLFIAVLLLLAALVFRQIWLQQHITALSSDLQVNLDTLEETTEEIQSELSALRSMPDGEQDPEQWEEITDVLNTVDEQIEAIGEDISEVTLALDPQLDATPSPHVENVQAHTGQDWVDQVFTIFAALVGIASVAIAILLGLAMRVPQQAPPWGRHHSRSMK